jgi:hypothetical protein
MRLDKFGRGAVFAIAGMLVGCVGQVGDEGGAGTSGSGGNTSTTGSGGNTQGSGGGSGSTSGGSGGNNAGSGGNNAGSGGSSATGGSGGSAPAAQLDINGTPKYYRVVRLSNAQWAAAVRTVLNVTTTNGLEQNFENAVSITGKFTNNELSLGLDQRNWQDFQSAAETLATQVTASDSALAKVYSGTDAAGFIKAVGRRAFRRPLTTAEQTTYMTLYTQGTSQMGSQSTFAKGAGMVIRALLQSPYFLFRMELGAKGAPLDAYEMAAKLALLLRGTGPDDKTLDMAAGTGKLDTADGAATLATTMLGESTAPTVMRQFHGEWLHFDDYELISKTGVSNYKETLNPELQEASYKFFDNIFSQGLGLKDILLSTTGYYGPQMASLYGLQAPASGYTQADLGAKRPGYFSQVPYLTLNGFNGDPNSILRGKTLNLDVLCSKLGPPATVIPPIPPLKPGQTNRQRIDTLTGTCGMSCHNDMINPLGFAFEHYDGMGQWRDTENGGLNIDSTGKYTFSDGQVKTWTDSNGLLQILASNPQAHTCFAMKLASFGLQRDIVVGDMPMVNTLMSTSMAAGSSSEKQILIQLVKNDAFRTHGGP